MAPFSYEEISFGLFWHVGQWIALGVEQNVWTWAGLWPASRLPPLRLPNRGEKQILPNPC